MFLVYLFFFALVTGLAFLTAFYVPSISIGLLLGIISLLIVFLLIFIKLEWSVPLLLFSMAQSFELPLKTSWGQRMPLFSDDIILVLILFAWLLHQLFLERGKWVKTSLNRPLLILIVLAFLSLIYSGFYLSGGELFANLLHLLKWTEYLAVFFIAVNFIKTKKQVNFLLKILVFAAVLVAGYAVYEKFSGHLLYKNWFNVVGGKRVMGYSSTFETGHELGAFLAIPIVLVVSFLFGEKRAWGKKILFLCLSGLFSYALLNSFSRSSYIGIYLALLTLAIFRKNWLLLSLLLLALPLGFFILPEEILGRVKVIYQEGFDRSATDRFSLWSQALAIFIKHPLLGIGFWNSYHPLYLTIAPHNSYLQILIEMGVLGLTVFIWLIRNLYRETKKLFVETKDGFNRNVSSAFFAILIGFLIASLTAEIFYWSRVIGFFWFLAGVVFVLRRIEKKNAQERTNHLFLQ